MNFQGIKKEINFHLFSPDQASITSFNVEENDFIVIATDGLWDNLPDLTVLEEIKKITVRLLILKNSRERKKQQCCFCRFHINAK
jgi:serine/threonine protein phosphatase PrpC